MLYLGFGLDCFYLLCWLLLSHASLILRLMINSQDRIFGSEENHDLYPIYWLKIYTFLTFMIYYDNYDSDIRNRMWRGQDEEPLDCF